MAEIEARDATSGSISKKYVITFSEKPFVDQLNEIQSQFNDAIRSGCQEISIDFERVDYLCSTSLAELVKMKKIASSKKMKVSLLNLSAYIMEVFRTTRLLSFFSNEDEAL